MRENSLKCKNDKVTFKMDLLVSFYPAKSLPWWMANDHEYRHCKEDKYTCQKKIAQPKESNDREEPHKMFLLRDCFGFILLF